MNKCIIARHFQWAVGGKCKNNIFVCCLDWNNIIISSGRGSRSILSQTQNSWLACSHWDILFIRIRHHPLGGIKSPLASVHNADKSGAGWKEIIKRLSWSPLYSSIIFPFLKNAAAAVPSSTFQGLIFQKQVWL